MPLRDQDKYRISVKGEPQEVSDIRNKILDTFDGLEFVEEGHKYFLHGEELCSVSSIAGRYESEFDTVTKARNYAMKNGETPEYWIDQWRFTNLKATVTGTQVHGYAEGLAWIQIGHPENIPEDQKYKYIEDKGWLIPTRHKEEAALKFWKEFPYNMHVVLPETRVFSSANPDLPRFRENYAGTFDLLVYYKHPTDDTKSGLIVMDWKGLDIKTPIFTKDGWKTMGNIQVNDVVYDSNGKETKVIHCSDIHFKKCYKIKFDNNTEIIADNDHRWLISFLKSKNCYKEKILTTEELFNLLEKIKNKRESFNIPKIKITEAIDNNVSLPIDPYVLGVWLGDGHSADGKITNMYDEIFKEIERRGFICGKDVSQGGTGKAVTRTVFGLEKLLRENNLIKNKHVPDIYLKSSKKQKIELLQGIMDTDGYYHPTKKRYILSTSREKQVDFCVKLLSSLGIKTTVIKYFKNINNKKIQCYDVSFKCDFYPFKIRKIETKVEMTSRSKYLTIKEVLPVDTVPTRCIEVDSETHTFLFGREFIVTHNTNGNLYKDFARTNFKMMKEPFDDLFDESYGGYTIQLSCYQIPLNDIGLKVIGRRIIWLKDDGTYEIVKVDDVTDKIRKVLS